MFYNKTHSIFHFGPLSIPNFALKGCHSKVHTKHYFLSKYLFAVVIDKLSFLEYNIVNCNYSRRTPRYLLHNHVSPFLIISQMHSQDASHALRGQREETRCRTLDQENQRDRTNMEWENKNHPIGKTARETQEAHFAKAIYTAPHVRVGELEWDKGCHHSRMASWTSWGRQKRKQRWKEA